MEYKSNNGPLMDDVPKEPLRNYILHDVAMTAVRRAMGLTSKYGVTACQLCPESTPERLEANEKTDGTCNGECQEHGFHIDGGHSMISAMIDIAKILEGRT